MKRTTIAMVIGTGTVAALLTACGADHSSSGTPTYSPIPQRLDSAQVLAAAQKTSETASPFQVDDGALELTDTSDTTQPIAINGM